MDESSILNILRNNLNSYEYILKHYKYNVFVETVINEILKDIKNDNKRKSN